MSIIDINSILTGRFVLIALEDKAEHIRKTMVDHQVTKNQRKVNDKPNNYSDKIVRKVIYNSANDLFNKFGRRCLDKTDHKKDQNKRRVYERGHFG